MFPTISYAAQGRCHHQYPPRVKSYARPPYISSFCPLLVSNPKKRGKKMKILHILVNNFFHMRVCIHSADHTTYATPLSDKWSCSQDWGVQIMFFAMISGRFLFHLYTVIWKYRLHNDFQEILEICTSSCTLWPRFMRPNQRLKSGQLHIMGKLHIKFQVNRARIAPLVKNRNTKIKKFSFLKIISVLKVTNLQPGEIFCIKKKISL